ncbi:MAG: hypothetical protein V4631_20940 [Pseudomonadota bacterium]
MSGRIEPMVDPAPIQVSCVREFVATASRLSVAHRSAQHELCARATAVLAKIGDMPAVPADKDSLTAGHERPDDGAGDVRADVTAILRGCGFEVRDYFANTPADKVIVYGTLDSAAILVEKLMSWSADE